MNIHQSDPKQLPDSEFLTGDVLYLVQTNQCRLMDGRRTPGVIESYDPESAMFRWRITDFEDRGKCWDLPAEDVSRFQFAKDSLRLKTKEILQVEEDISKFQRPLRIYPDTQTAQETEKKIQRLALSARQWLERSFSFLQSDQGFNLDDRRGMIEFSKDLKSYMTANGLLEIEERTAENIVLNPNSGEWVKGLEIVMAEMGLATYVGKMTRTSDIWVGEGSKVNRSRYLLHRLAFLRVFFEHFGMEEIVLYRGMSSEREWMIKPKSLISTSFSLEVAQSFTDFDRASRFIQSYLLKRTVPISRVFMTCLETEAMNRQYKEAEALVMARAGEGWW